ncbi:hypothetical protein D3C85_1108690 [compost metagenome]
MRQVQAQQIESDQLRGVSFRRSYRNFRSSPCCNNVVRFTRNGTSYNIRNSQHVCTTTFCFTKRRQRIRRFTGLAHNNDKCILCNNRGTITIFRRYIRLNRNTRHFLNHIFPNHTGMERRSTSHDMHTANVANRLRRNRQFIQRNALTVRRNTTPHRITVRLRLVIDFFQHKMIKSSFFRRNNIPIDMEHFPGNKIPL